MLTPQDWTPFTWFWDQLRSGLELYLGTLGMFENLVQGLRRPPNKRLKAGLREMSLRVENSAGVQDMGHFMKSREDRSGRSTSEITPGKTSGVWNRKGIIGLELQVLVVAADMYEVGTFENPLETAKKGGFSWAGDWAMGVTAAELGALAFSWTGPVAPQISLGFGLAGTVYGGILGEEEYDFYNQ